MAGREVFATRPFSFLFIGGQTQRNNLCVLDNFGRNAMKSG